jgi:hypothetical protein
MILRYDGAPPRMSELPDDFSLLPMGEAHDVRTRISESLPDVDWSDPARGLLISEEYSIKFGLQEDGVVESLMLIVRGGGDPVEAIARLCAANGWAALDTSTGEFMDLQQPSRAGWESFQAFRDKVLATVGRREPWYRRLLKKLRRRA